MLKVLVLSLFFSLSAFSSLRPLSISHSESIAKSFVNLAHKYKLDLQPTEWIKKHYSEEDGSLLLTNSKTEILASIRVDYLQRFKIKNPSLKRYVRYYTTQMPKFKMNLIGSKRLNKYSYQLRVKDDSSQKIAIQTIVWRESNAVILTCNQKSNDWAKLQTQCDGLITSIQWLK
ncbi:MAG: hypothetical protein AB8E15_08285 [Bdellovibrionales bacterium]